MPLTEPKLSVHMWPRPVDDANWLPWGSPSSALGPRAGSPWPVPQGSPSCPEPSPGVSSLQH